MCYHGTDINCVNRTIEIMMGIIFVIFNIIYIGFN